MPLVASRWLARVVVGACACTLASRSSADDWPQWRADAGHSGATEGQLSEPLHLSWSRDLPAPRPAWPEQPKLDFDKSYEPVVAGQRLVVGSAVTDAVTCYDTRSGQVVWQFFTEGPVRLPVAIDAGLAYAASDDGHLYCLKLDTGEVVWKFRGGPSDKRILGNGRLISMWPARGGPVAAQGRVYFAASIWPFMGVFVHALNAATGEVVWTSDGEGSRYQLQPHNSNSFAGVAPQGSLTIVGDVLLVPGGRSVPAAYDLASGQPRYFHLADNGKRGGGSAVVARDNVFYNGGHAYEASTGQALASVPWPLVPGGTELIGYHQFREQYEAFDLTAATIHTSERTDRKGNVVKLTDWKLPEKWKHKLPGGADLIRVGRRLFAAEENRIVAIEPATTPAPAVTWETTVEGNVVRLLSADDRLFAVTDGGRLYAFAGEPPGGQPALHLGGVEPTAVDRTDFPLSGDLAAAVEILADTRGHLVAWSAGNLPALEKLAESRLRADELVLAVDSDVAAVSALRKFLGDRNGHPLAVIESDVVADQLPPYLASGMLVTDAAMLASSQGDATLRVMYESLRPFGGLAVMVANQEQHQQIAQLASRLEGAAVERRGGLTLLTRAGPLAGSANWTHEHADAANTRVSRDGRVRAPLGLLWFGGPPNAEVLPRHGHGPQPQVLDGRVIVEGTDMLRAVDAYTGRLLWRRELPGVGKYYDNYAHQAGANATGANYVSAADGIYVAYEERCLRLHPDTGETVGEFRLPAAETPKASEAKAVADTVADANVAASDDAATKATSAAQPHEPELTPSPLWGYLNVVDDYLIGGAQPLVVAVGKDQSLVKGSNENLSASKRLVVMNRYSGKVLWSAVATHYFRHNAVCVGGGRLYAVDLLSDGQRQRLKRRGLEPSGDSRLVVYDLATGRELWTTDDGVFGTYLSYSAEYDVLVESGRPARDTLADEVRQMRAFRAASGEILWQEKYDGPAMLHGQKVFCGTRACDLLTGKPVLRRDPLSGVETPWNWSRNYGCNTPMASQHLLTFRSGAAGYFDLTDDGGTANLGGFRSGCSNNLVVAGGVLSAPDYTRSCTCSYQNQTSLAFVHMPEAELWTEFPVAKDQPVVQLALNIGAPGSRRSPDGTLWLHEFAGVQVEYDGPGPYSRHPSVVQAGGLPWVYSSGCRGIRRLTLKLAPEVGSSASFTVRLHFSDPDQAAPDRRKFAVAVQGRTVLENLDVAAESGGRFRPLVKEFKGIDAGDRIEISFAASESSEPAPGAPHETLPILSGLEVIRE